MPEAAAEKNKQNACKQQPVASRLNVHTHIITSLKDLTKLGSFHGLSRCAIILHRFRLGVASRDSRQGRLAPPLLSRLYGRTHYAIHGMQRLLSRRRQKPVQPPRAICTLRYAHRLLPKRIRPFFSAWAITPFFSDSRSDRRIILMKTINLTSPKNSTIAFAAILSDGIFPAQEF